MTELDEIQARADAATKRLAAWDDRPERVARRLFSTKENGYVDTRQLHPSYESALLASAKNASEAIPKLVKAIREVKTMMDQIDVDRADGRLVTIAQVQQAVRTAIREALDD